MNLKLWNRKNDNNNEPATSKDIASILKGTVAHLIQPKFAGGLTEVELKVLNHLISYLDTFFLKCFVNGKLKHYTWITTRLLEASIILGVSNDSRMKSLVKMINALMECIVLERAEDSGDKEEDN